MRGMIEHPDTDPADTDAIFISNAGAAEDEWLCNKAYAV